VQSVKGECLISELWVGPGVPPTQMAIPLQMERVPKTVGRCNVACLKADGREIEPTDTFKGVDLES